MGLANVDERLRAAFGDDYGLLVETAEGAAPRSPCACPSSAPGCMYEQDASVTSPTSSPASGTAPERLRVLALDDEEPALDELVWLLGQEERIGEVIASDSAAEALRILHERPVDAIFMDVQMPGLTGLDLARVLSRFTTKPPVVFVTAHEQHAVDAFELNVVDYVLKPVRDERLAEAVRRVVGRIEGRSPCRRPTTTTASSSSSPG